MLPFGLLLGAVWGGMIAAFIEFAPFGRYIATRLTWLLVSIGVAGDLLIALLLVDSAGMVAWWQVAALFPVSAAPLVLRSLYEAYREHRELMMMLLGRLRDDLAEIERLAKEARNGEYHDDIS